MRARRPVHRSQRERRRRPRLWALPIVFVLAACAAPPLDHPPEGYRYVNERLGVGLDLAPGWSGFTQREGAPEYFQKLLPPDKDPDASPLLLAVNESQQAFLRLLVEPVGDLDVEEYFAALYATMGEQVQAREAKLSKKRGSVRWLYGVRSGPVLFSFYETLVVYNGRALRLGLWTPESLLPHYEAEFEQISASFLLQTTGGWHAPWRGLETTLKDGAFDYVDFASSPEPALECDENAGGGGPANLLWEVATERGRLALFGSLHFGRPDFYPLAEPVESAFSEAESLVVELDARDLQETTALLQQRAKLPDGHRLQDELSPRVYDRLDAELAKLGLPTERFTQLRPWALATFLTALKFQSMGYDAGAGVDQYLLRRAGDKNVIALETAEEQIGMLDSLDGELFLAYTLLSMETFEAHAGEMVHAWRCGDDATLAHLLLDDPGGLLPGVSDVVEKLFDERNQRMAGRLQDLMERGGRYFVVVGAGHLVGEEGIPALLAARGYEVTRR